MKNKRGVIVLTYMFVAIPKHNLGLKRIGGDNAGHLLVVSVEVVSHD